VLDALDAVLEREGAERAHFLLEKLTEKARRSGAHLPFSANTAYLNTIPVSQEDRCPGDLAMERRIRAFIRWNAIATVMRANKQSPASAAISPVTSPLPRSTKSASTIFSAPQPKTTAEICCISRVTSPRHLRPCLPRSRITEEQLLNFRQEVAARACPPTRIPG